MIEEMAAIEGGLERLSKRPFFFAFDRSWSAVKIGSLIFLSLKDKLEQKLLSHFHQFRVVKEVSSSREISNYVIKIGTTPIADDDFAMQHSLATIGDKLRINLLAQLLV